MQFIIAAMLLAVVGLTAHASGLQFLPKQQLVRRSAAAPSMVGSLRQQEGGGSRRLQGSGDAVGHNLGSAPPTIAISGFSCHPNAARDMALDPAPIRSRPHYVSADGAQHLYYSDQVAGGSWLVDNDTAESTGYIASIEDSATFPPPGAHTEWLEDCTGGPEPSPVGDDSCRYHGDGECDDGSTGLAQYCAAGTDTTDCGPPGPNSCRYSHDGEWCVLHTRCVPHNGVGLLSVCRTAGL